MIEQPMRKIPKRILIVAGEASADRYGARLVEKLFSLHGRDALEFYGTGGDEMRQAGVDLLCHVRSLAHIGVREALSSLRTYYRTLRKIVDVSRRQPPRAAILLDFPDFNLRLAKKMKRLGVRVIYYISPQLWAWRSGRIRAIREYVDKMLVILPFEEEYYRERGIEVEFVGHPLLEGFAPDCEKEAFFKRHGLDPGCKTVALLPGSRRKEVDYILPPLLHASQRILREIPAQFLISAAPTVDPGHLGSLTQEILRHQPNRNRFHILTDSARDILANADFAFVKSGTSSLEAALVGTPFLITYKISSFSWFVGSMLIRIPAKGLVNLIAQEKIVPELFQSDAEPGKLACVALRILENPVESAAMKSRLAGIRERLGALGASETAAAAVSAYL
jgi:lipid-A-disaccharide synthase